MVILVLAFPEYVDSSPTRVADIASGYFAAIDQRRR